MPESLEIPTQHMPESVVWKNNLFYHVFFWRDKQKGVYLPKIYNL